MRDIFKAYFGKSAGLVGLHSQSVTSIEVEEAFDTYVTFFDASGQARLHIPYASIKAVVESNRGVRWPRITFKRRLYNILIHVDANRAQMIT